MEFKRSISILAGVVCAGWALAAQQAKPTPTPEQQAEAKDEKDEDFKEEEPKTANEKARQEEIKKKACPAADKGFSHETDKTSHPTPEPAPEKALVYVLRPASMGGKIQTKLGVDGHWAGVNRGKSYFFVELPPGEHYLCSKAENTSVLALGVEAGKTYYVEQKVKMGFMKARNQLALLKEAEGKEKLAKCHPSVFKEKP